MEKEFTPYEQALALKELGFNEPCFAYYLNEKLNIFHSTSVNDRINSKTKDVFNSDVVTAPTFSQAFRWFREKYDILHNIFFIEIDDINKFSASLKTDYDKKWTHLGFIQNVNTYEEAELECLKKLIEIVKNK